jgi:hypothetical protein
VSARLLGGSWLVGAGIGLMALALSRGNYGSLALPFLVGATGYLLLTGQRSRHFPGTELERGLDRLFALLLPVSKVTTTETAHAALARAKQLARLRQGVRRWGKELQVITTDGYQSASRISALHELTGEQDDRVLVAEVVRVLSAERARAGADLALAADPVSMLAYGLGARPAGADLTSLDDLLRDLGLAGEGDELRMHFDDVVVVESSSTNLHLTTDAQRGMFRDLAGASFVLGAAARILELASLAAAPEAPVRAAAVV